MPKRGCPKLRVVVHRMLLRGGSFLYVVAQSIKCGGSFRGCPRIAWWTSEMRDFLGQTWRRTIYVTWTTTLVIRGSMPHITWMPIRDCVEARHSSQRGCPYHVAGRTRFAYVMDAQTSTWTHYNATPWSYVGVRVGRCGRLHNARRASCPTQQPHGRLLALNLPALYASMCAHSINPTFLLRRTFF